MYCQGKNFDLFNDTLFYIPALSDFIYKIYDGRVISKIKVRTSKENAIQKDSLNIEFNSSSNEYEWFQQHNKLAFFDNVVVSDGTLIFNYQCRFTQTGIYSFTSGNAAFVEGYWHNELGKERIFPFQTLGKIGSYHFGFLNNAFKDNLNPFLHDEQNLNPILTIFKVKAF